MGLQMLSEIKAEKKSPGFMFAMRKQQLLQPEPRLILLESWGYVLVAAGQGIRI
jgi:hypothetical protein